MRNVIIIIECVLADAIDPRKLELDALIAPGKNKRTHSIPFACLVTACDIPSFGANVVAATGDRIVSTGGACSLGLGSLATGYSCDVECAAGSFASANSASTVYTCDNTVITTSALLECTG